MKVLYFDTETTGTDPHKNEIVQLAAIIEIDGEVVEEVNLECRPTNLEAIDPEALKTIGKTVDDLLKRPEPKEMMNKLWDIFNRHIDKYKKSDKFYPAGHNVQFDLEFLQAFWKKHGDIYGTGSYQNWRCLDTRILANIMIAEKKLDVPDVKLSTLCTYYQISLAAHDALNDIRATRLLYRRMWAHLIGAPWNLVE